MRCTSSSPSETPSSPTSSRYTTTYSLTHSHMHRHGHVYAALRALRHAAVDSHLALPSPPLSSSSSSLSFSIVHIVPRYQEHERCARRLSRVHTCGMDGRSDKTSRQQLLRVSLCVFHSFRLYASTTTSARPLLPPISTSYTPTLLNADVRLCPDVCVCVLLSSVATRSCTVATPVCTSLTAWT